jgi:hypothetical protein
MGKENAHHRARNIEQNPARFDRDDPWVRHLINAVRSKKAPRKRKTRWASLELARSIGRNVFARLVEHDGASAIVLDWISGQSDAKRIGRASDEFDGRRGDRGPEM